MTEAVTKTQALDEHLLEVVRALHAAVKRGVSHSKEPEVMDEAIKDCKEILDVIMEGHVQEWLH
jgi:hypothetical protein